MSKLFTLALFGFVLFGNTLLASIIVTVGDNQLQPNQADQRVPILVSSDGTPEVAAFNLVAQLGDGGGGNAEPVFSGVEDTLDGVDFVTDSIWPAAASASGSGPVEGFPVFATASVAIDNGGTVIADGKLVTLLIDTTGFDSGTFDLRLSGSDGPDSNFVLPDGVEFAPEIRNGTVSIVPEPNHAAFACVAIMIFCTTFGRRSSRA